MFLNYIIIIVSLLTGQLHSYVVVSNTAACEPNRVYKKDDVTCICTKEGRWPHQNCSASFETKKINSRICEPDSYVTVDCNVCRCSKTGNIDKEFCTKHNCDGYKHIRVIRRSSNDKSKCEPNHWYAFSDCRLCYCFNKNSLLCNRGLSPKKVLLGSYNLTDCGSNLLSDIRNLLSTKDPLGLKRSNKKQKQVTTGTDYTTPQFKTTPTLKVSKDDIFSLMFNRDSNKEDKESEDSDDNDVESEEDVPEPESQVHPKDKQIARLAANTVIPFDENDKDDPTNYSNESERNNSGDFDDNKREVDMNKSEDLYKSREELIDENIKQEPKVQRTDKTVINLNIPGILEKMFHFRRSMVSIDNANCVPGSTVAVDCNTCFCLKNGKMLCTQKKCD